MREFRNVFDMIDYFYGEGGQVAKADAPVLSSTTGFHNDVFGAMAFSQLNYEANVFGVLPKYPWPKSGFRVITADAGSTAGGGTSEGTVIPDTTKPTLAEVTVNPKSVIETFNVSIIQEGLVKKTADDDVGDMEFLRGYFSNIHAKRLNEQLLRDHDTAASAATGFESIDRVTTSSAATIAAGYATTDADIYDITRSSSSWSDAQVSHNSGTDRTLTFPMIRDLLATISAAGGKTNLIITGTDTYWRIIGLAESQVRYMGAVKQGQQFKIGINGVQTDEGIGYGVRVATLWDIPLISSQSVQKDTISRIYLLDTTTEPGTGIPRLGISLLYPTLYFESGMGAADRNPFGINFMGTQGLYFTAGQLVCTFLAAQGQIRDLK